MKIGAISFSALFALYFSLTTTGCSLAGEADKSAYASLQNAEYSHRGEEDYGVIYERVGGLLLAGMSANKGGRVWVVLNERKPDGRIYSIPDGGEAGITCDLVIKVTESNEVDVEVAKALHSSCLTSP